jgi:zeta-carotene desaturase
VVVGGGLAGIAAALALSDRGIRVTLLEAKRRLGGRATSFTDAVTGETLDNCQHVALGCCSEYLAFCRRLGVLNDFDWYDEQYWVLPGGHESVLKPGILPAPLHYTGSFLGCGFLGPASKLGIGRAMGAIAFADLEAWQDLTFGQVLRELDQTEESRRRFWDPIVVSACNLDPDDVAATLAAKVFRDGFMAGADAGRIGVPKVPLVRLYDAALAELERAGSEVRLGVSAQELGADWVITSRDERLVADRVVCALPMERAKVLLSAPELHGIANATHSPILGVHMHFDRPVIGRPHAVLLDVGTQWVFRKDDAGAKVHCVISGAHAWVDLAEAEILDRVQADITTCFPHSRAAKRVWGKAVREKRATFAATPEFEKNRPNAGLLSDGVVLAGDYTNTQWPATMEGAVRSGLEAAKAAAKSLSLAHS